MKANISTTRRLLAVWLLFSVTVASTAKSSRPYLPVTGPTPLRFQFLPTKPLLLLNTAKATKPPEVLADKSVDTSADAANSPTPTNTLPDLHYSVGEPRPPTDAVVEPDNASPPPLHVLKDQPLILTQQMLAEYFKPAVTDTNGVSVGVILPVNLSFNPPTDKPQPRSRATFKTE